MEYLIQIKQSQVFKQEESNYNALQITGQNTNGTLGIGNEEPQRGKIFQLAQLQKRKLYKVVCGDFHTLALCSSCSCVRPTFDRCQGKDSCKGGSVVMGWGFNVHGQVDGISSEQSVLRPRIVGKLLGKQIQNIAASRSRSIAVTASGEVLEWGLREGEQFQVIGQLPETNVTQIELGSAFNLYLGKSGIAYF